MRWFFHETTISFSYLPLSSVSQKIKYGTAQDNLWDYLRVPMYLPLRDYGNGRVEWRKWSGRVRIYSVRFQPYWGSRRVLGTFVYGQHNEKYWAQTTFCGIVKIKENNWDSNLFYKNSYKNNKFQVHMHLGLCPNKSTWKIISNVWQRDCYQW
jgi:hypothetical protein